MQHVRVFCEGGGGTCGLARQRWEDSFGIYVKVLILSCIFPVVFKYAKERRILVSQNTTVYMC